MTNHTLTSIVLRRNSSFLKIKLIGIILIIVSIPIRGQVTLGTSPYIQNFNTTTLPEGWTTRINATSTSLGTNVSPTTTGTWGSTTGEFRFAASAKSPLTSLSSTTAQNAATDRCLAVRTVVGFGDPGQAFTFQIANTIGLTNFNMTFNAQLLYLNEKTTIYRVEYGLGTTPSIWTQVGSTFTDLGIYSGVWGVTDITRSFGNSLDNQSTNVWIRISSLDVSTGSGSRCTFGIDDVRLSWSDQTSVTNPATFTATTASISQINLYTTANANSDNVVVVSNATGSFSTPTDGVAPGNVGDSFAGGTIIYKGFAASISNHTGLTANTNYSYKAFSYDSSNKYSSGLTANATTNNLLAPNANTASSISATEFTANWSPFDGATSYKLDVSTLPIFGTASPLTLTEGFDGGTTPSTNWTFTAIGGTYISARNYGVSSPSLQLDATNDRILTPTLSGVATQLSFWIKGLSTDASSSLLVEGYNGSTWVTIKNLTNSIPTTGTTYTFNFSSTPALPTNIIQFRFTFIKSAGNISFDDVSINYNVITPSQITGYNNLDVGNTTSQTITNLSPNTTYYYRIRAANSNSTSENSNTQTATTSNTIAVNSSINASTLPACSTCDVSVSNGATLNIDEPKTFNIITAAAGGKITNASTLTANTFNLNSNTIGTATYLDNGTTQIVTTNVEQYLTSGRNWYVSSPITAANTNALSTANSVVSWDETIGEWATQQNTTLIPLRGYISVSTNETKPITFSGTLNNGVKTIELTRTTGKTKEGFNLVGNPYPSYLNWTSAIATAANTLTTIWYRTQVAGAYAFHTYNATGGIGTPSSVTGEIPPMQAFWVRVNAGGGTLAFNNSMRSHGSGSNPLKVQSTTNSQQKILRLQVSNGKNNDEAVIYFNTDASDSYDAYDSPKMTNANASIPEIFTLAGTEKVVINGLNTLPAKEELPLGFTTGEANTFTIKANRISNFDTDTKVILRDKLLNTEQELTTGTSYSFASDATSTINRFGIIFRSALTTTSINKIANEQNIEIYKNANNQIEVNFLGDISVNSSVQVYNSLGQLLISKQLTDTKTIIQSPNYSGVFMVKVVSGEKNTTKKVVSNQ